MSEKRVKGLLKKIIDPCLNQDIISLQMVHNLIVDGQEVSFDLHVPTPLRTHSDTLYKRCQEALLAGGYQEKKIQKEPYTRAIEILGKQPLPGVKNLIAIASGKGGVGKSTLTVNLALALAKEGARVGVLDCDIYGPSIPSLVGLHEGVQADEKQRIIPHRRFGVQWLSMGFLVPRGQAIAWRGPMLHKIIQQFLFQAAWEGLDYLLLDLPPGTGDVQLSLTERPPLSAAVIVTTPQDVALIDAKKGYEMFQKVSVPILGIVENMSWFTCQKCSKKHFVFGQEGGSQMARAYDLPWLEQLPLDPGIPSDLGVGEPLVFRQPSSILAKPYFDLAQKVASLICQKSLTPIAGQVPKPGSLEV